MKYVLLVIFFSTGVGGDYQGETFHTQFTIEYENLEKCFAALVETEEILMARGNVRALSVSCRPKFEWDKAMSVDKFKVE